VRSGFPSLPAVQNDPLLSSLRDERYRELVGELRDPDPSAEPDYSMMRVLR